MAMVTRCGVDPVVNWQCVPLVVSWARVFRKLIFSSVHYITKVLHNFFRSGFFFRDTDNSQDKRGKEGTDGHLYFYISLPSAYE